MKKAWLSLAILLCVLYVWGTTFAEQTIPIPGVYKSSEAWGDYDGDGDLDLLIAGQASTTDTTRIARIYRNNAGTFVDSGTTIAGYSSAAVAWGDYDNDGDLDFAISGLSGGIPLTKIYNNSAGEFSPHTSSTLVGLEAGAMAWGDYDSDGDLDLLVTGKDGTGTPRTIIYINTLGTFTTSLTIATGVWSSSVAWGDYDNDGDLDFVISGATASTEVTEIWKNTAGVFAKLTTGTTAIIGVSLSTVAWADYDNDGDLDLFMAGKRTVTYYTKLYRNDSGTFVDTAVDLPGVQNASLDLGDYDNDGDADLLLTGEYSDGTTTENYSRIYRNNSFIYFYDETFSLPGVRMSCVTWGDYDADRDLDFALTGLDNTGTPITKIYKNNGSAANLAPTAPTGLAVQQIGEYIKFSWLPGSDTITPTNALSYNLRIGTSSGGVQILPPNASSTGYRRKAGLGIASSNCYWMIKAAALPFGDFYWSVQAVDGAGIGSPWATQASFNGGKVLSPNGGESWVAGSTKIIYWYSMSNVTNVNIYFSSNNGSTWTKLNVTTVLSNLGRFSFTVPSVSSSQCLMKVEDNANPALYDVSDANFTVGTGSYPFIAVIYPSDANIKLQVGQQYYITWTSSGVSNVKIELSLDEGLSWSTVVASVAASANSYLTTIPDTPAAACYYRISSTTNPAIYDWSDNPFAIVKLSLLFPNAGDHVLAPPPSSNKLNVTWTSSGIANLKVEFSKDGGNTWRVLIASTTAATGSYAGTIAVDDISPNCLVRLTDVLDASVTSQSSGTFTIADLDVVYPSATNIKLQTGRAYQVKWTSVGVSTPLKIQYATNYTSTTADWITIATDIAPTDTMYVWTVPAMQGSITCRIRISARDQDSFADISDNNFTISSLQLLTPNGGENWYYPPTRSITWQSSTVTTVKLELSLDGGTTWPVTIATGLTASSGTYSWSASEYNSPNARVRVSDTAAPTTVYDESDNVFTLYQHLQLLRPNGGETLITGTTYNIRWRAEPDISSVKLDYSTNGGTSWSTITSTALTASLGTYSWLVPGTVGSTYKVRVRRDPATTPNTIDISDANFSVSSSIPPVAFSGTPVSGNVPLSVQFTDSTPWLSEPTTGWSWTFGDGATSTLKNPLHVYTVVGTYSVSLTVTNTMDAPRSLTKTNYIQVNPNYAQIDLQTASPMRFYANVGQTTAWADVIIKNTGTSNLIVNSLNCTGSGFSYQYANLNVGILPGATDVIKVRFSPLDELPVNGILTINSNANNMPVLQVGLVGNDVPAVVQNLVVTIVDQSAVLTWSPVSVSVGGVTLTPDLYVIEYNETPYENVDNYYYYLWATPTATFTHYLVASFADNMFYRVRAVMNLSPAQRTWLESLRERPEKLTWDQISRRLETLRN